jgi:hypothetical protein
LVLPFLLKRSWLKQPQQQQQQAWLCTLSVAHKAFTPCCEVASLPSKWLSPCPSMLRLLWECLYRCCCWLAGWLASVKKQQNPTDSNHCASDTESVWSSGVTSNSWEHFLSSCQLQTQTSRWVQEEEHRKHKRASHVPDRCGQQQQQDESSLNSTLLAACLSMAWIWFPSTPSPPLQSAITPPGCKCNKKPTAHPANQWISLLQSLSLSLSHTHTHTHTHTPPLFSYLFHTHRITCCVCSS